MSRSNSVAQSQSPRHLEWVADVTRPLPSILTFDEVAVVLRVSRRTVSRYAADGRLRTVTVGGITRVSRADLANFLAGADQ
jgi:excisionase family DNA binding protein